ncbi:MAG: hypothetical protein VM34scaffold347_34 [Phage 66_12]|jgi:hypothetical protein|nr:MAG: hypothetical protein VM34scaffold347_34 [Phage 66_12]
MSNKSKQDTKNTDTTVNVDVDAEHEGTRDVTVDRDVDVTVSSAKVPGYEVAQARQPVGDPPPDPDYVDMDWTVDYGGDPVHPTEIPRDEYIIPLPEPEAPPVEPEP